MLDGRTVPVRYRGTEVRLPEMANAGVEIGELLDFQMLGGRTVPVRYRGTEVRLPEMANAGVEIGELLELPYAGWAHCTGQRDHEVGRPVHQLLIIPLLAHKSIMNKTSKKCFLSGT
jgi:hypothetical protein